jgi:hypothetical protein
VISDHEFCFSFFTFLLLVRRILPFFVYPINSCQQPVASVTIGLGGPIQIGSHDGWLSVNNGSIKDCHFASMDQTDRRQEVPGEGWSGSALMLICQYYYGANRVGNAQAKRLTRTFSDLPSIAIK